MTIVDHLYLLLIAIAAPVAGYFSFQRLLRRIDAGESVAPTELYRVTAMSHWALFAMLLVLWSLSDRAWDALGFGLVFDTRFLVGAALTIAFIAFLARQLAHLEDKDKKDLGKLECIFPRTRAELAGFYGLSLTAGIVEEALWRGFLFWYLGHFMPLWVAAIVSAIGFGLAHAYQGIKAIPQVIVIGGAFAGLYLLTGSLWLPIILHAAVDMLQGRAVYGIIRSAEPATESPSP